MKEDKGSMLFALNAGVFSAQTPEFDFTVTSSGTIVDVGHRSA